jgi:hypothetical protein
MEKKSVELQSCAALVGIEVSREHFTTVEI